MDARRSARTGEREREGFAEKSNQIGGHTGKEVRVPRGQAAGEALRR